MMVPPKYKRLAERVDAYIAQLNPPPPMPPVQRVIVQHDDPELSDPAAGIPGRLALVRRVIMPQPTTVPELPPEPPRGIEPRVPGTRDLKGAYQ
jgi:hypothetical protein